MLSLVEINAIKLPSLVSSLINYARRSAWFPDSVCVDPDKSEIDMDEEVSMY